MIRYWARVFLREGPRWLNYRGHRGWNALRAWAAYRLPRWLVYWVLIRAGVSHIESGEVVPKVPFVTVLKRAG